MVTDPSPEETAMTGPRSMLTADECEQIIRAALPARDMETIAAALTVMAVQDPHRAKTVHDTLRLGIDLTTKQETP